MIYRRFKRRMQRLGQITFAVAAFALVAYDVLRHIDWQMPAFAERLIEALVDPPPVNQDDEIERYVIFKKVPYKNREVVTGIEYASDRNRSITHQWCYLTGSTQTGGSISRLPLATKAEAGTPSASDFSPTALTDFNLTHDTVRDLINSHCRFH